MCANDRILMSESTSGLQKLLQLDALASFCEQRQRQQDKGGGLWNPAK